MEHKQLFSCLLVIFLSSGCAVLSENNDLVLTKKIQPSTILEIQSDELFEMPGAKQQPVVAV